LAQGVFGGVLVVFDADLVGDLARRELLLGMGEQKFENFDLQCLGGQLFAAAVFFLFGHDVAAKFNWPKCLNFSPEKQNRSR